MDRNTEIFENSLPVLNYNRSTFRYNYPHKTTFNVGELVPFYVNTLVQPGDTFKIDMSYVLRLTTPYFPTMDNLYLDVYFFTDEWLNEWDSTKEFWGENLTTPWVSSTEKLIPIIWSGSNGYTSKSIMDHMGGNRLYTGNIYSQRLGLNTYLSVYNEYFRDQNLIAPISIDKSDADITFDPTNSALGGPLLKVAKSHSYFQSALLEPTKPTPGWTSAPTLPIGTSAPVYTGVNNPTKLNTTPLNWQVIPGQSGTFTLGDYIVGGHSYAEASNPGTNLSARAYDTTANLTNAKAIAPINLYADLTQAVGATLNAQRYIIAIQHIFEKNAVFGCRYREQILARWGVSTKDASMHIPEYLGGFRDPVNLYSSVQTSSTDTTSPQGNVAGYSVTANSDSIFTKSFDTHSILIGVLCVRQDYVYSQGVSCQNSKRRLFDFYQNELAHIGMQPIYTDELYATSGSQTATNRSVFGYKPPFQEYRQENGDITGELRPEYRNSSNVNAPLDKWTYAPKFNSAPVLSQQFIEETPENVDRTIVLPSSTVDQFIMDINLSVVKVSEVPQWGTPGLDKF